MRTENKFLSGQAAVVLCSVLWSTSGLFLKFTTWHPSLVIGSRSVIAALFLFAVRRIAGKTPRQHVNILRLFLCGLCYAGTMITFVIANRLTTSANAILLQYTAPVWAGLLGWFLLKERPHWEQWGALVFVAFGMFLVFSGGLATASLSGDVLSLISGILFGANSVVLRYHKNINSMVIMICSHLTCAVCSIPFFFLYPPVFNAANVLSIAFMGIFSLGAACALFSFGIKRITAVQAMLTCAIEPVLNPVWVLLVTGERPGSSVVIGGSIIIAAVIISSIIGGRRLT